jgi:proteasome assembly chaperone (PAC2) family protein
VRPGTAGGAISHAGGGRGECRDAQEQGFYLLAKLGMHVIAESEASDLFDVDQVEVKEGLIQPGHCPRNRFFLWTDPKQRHDLVVLLGEAQPPIGKYRFCRKLLDYGRELSVERVFTFAAMATQMHPEHRSRVFGAATDRESLEELKRLELEVLKDGHIGGLNGVLLGAAAESGLRGACLLGEMPHIFSQLPFPKASLAILSRVEQTYGRQLPPEEEGYSPETAEEERLGSADQQRIEGLFAQAERDRSKAFELKQELDRLGVFKDYEDRFLDLFKKAG